MMMPVYLATRRAVYTAFQVFAEDHRATSLYDREKKKPRSGWTIYLTGGCAADVDSHHVTQDGVVTVRWQVCISVQGVSLEQFPLEIENCKLSLLYMMASANS